MVSQPSASDVPPHADGIAPVPVGAPPPPHEPSVGGAGGGTGDPVANTQVRAREARGWGYLWYRLRSSPLTLVGFALILLYLLVAAAAPILAPTPAGWEDPYDVRPRFTQQLLEPNDPRCDPACPFGTTEFGADLYYAVIWGTRISIAMGLSVTAFGVIVGLFLGLVAGWYGGWLDDLLLRTTDIFLSLPLLVLAIAIVTAFEPGLFYVGLALSLVWWPPYTRLVRGQVLALRDSQFVEAARSSGLPNWYIMLRHVLPNSISPVIVQATLDIGIVVLVGASLSFIGFTSGSSLQPEWGRLVALGQNYMATGQWWTVVFPGLAIFGFVLGFNLLGDGLRDIVDPRGKR